MDILRKELNGIYERQRLGDELLDGCALAALKTRVEAVVELGDSCAVITDAAADRCYIFCRSFGPLIGLTDTPEYYCEVNSSDEDAIYEKIHPEDLVEKRMLEYEYFKLTDSVPPAEKRRYKATCRLRMRDVRGEYRYVDNSTQIASLSPAGKMWLILCRYDLSPDQSGSDGIGARIVNTASGIITTLRFGEKRNHILSNREKEVLRLVKAGKPSKQIAAMLGISVNTVNRHRQNIIEKLSVGSCVEAITAATAMKLI